MLLIKPDVKPNKQGYAAKSIAEALHLARNKVFWGRIGKNVKIFIGTAD